MKTDEFSNYLKTLGNTDGTIRVYCSDLKNLHERGIISEFLGTIDYQKLLNYQTTNKTKHKWLHVLKKYAKFLVNSGTIVSVPEKLATFELPKAERKVQPVVENEQLEKLLSIKCSDEIKCIMRVLIITGCRISSLAGLAKDDIKDDYIIFRVAKGGKPFISAIDKETHNILWDYINKNKVEDYLFTDFSGRPSSTDAIRNRLRRALGEDYANPHKLRRSIATSLLERGADIHDIKEFLNHSSIATTSNYINLSTKAKLKSVIKNHPFF